MEKPKSYENIIGEVVCPIPHPIPKHLAFRKQYHFYPRIIVWLKFRKKKTPEKSHKTWVSNDNTMNYFRFQNFVLFD